MDNQDDSNRQKIPEKIISGYSIAPGVIDPRHLVPPTTPKNGDMFYSDGTNFVKLGAGTNGQVLGNLSGTPTWQTSSATSDGWISESNTATWISATSLKFLGVDVSLKYKKGTRFKCTNNSTTFYGTCSIDATFSTDTTVTFAANTDFSLTNSAITAPYYSYEAIPQGYPTFFNFTPTFTSSGGAFTNAPTSNKAIYSVIGNQATILVRFTYNSTSGGSGNTLVGGLSLTPTTVYGGYGAGSSSGNALFCQIDATPQLVIAKYDATTCIVNSQIINVGVIFQF